MTEPGAATRPPAGADPVRPDDLVADAIELARRFGADAAYSRGGGGNISAKSGGVLRIKPSGVALATLAADDLVLLDMAPLLELLEGRAGLEAERQDPSGLDPAMRVAARARLPGGGTRRPSVELLFHALLPETFVLHTHPIIPNAVTCNVDGEAIARRLFGDAVLWVPYVDPGLPLARAILERRRAHEQRTGQPAPAVTFMGNHGIIVAADSALEVVERSEWAMVSVRAELERSGLPLDDRDEPEPDDRDARRRLVAASGPTLRAALAPEGPLKAVTFDAASRAAAFTATPSGRAVVEGGPLTPDQIVYAGSWTLLFDPPAGTPEAELPGLLRDALRDHVDRRGEPPRIVVVPGVGIFAAGDSWKEADLARHIYLDALKVSEAADAIGAVRPLAAREREFIETWEVEAYRRGAAAFGRSPGRFAGGIALVTGAAQGFGLAIAQGLAAEGGHVVLADVNVELAGQEAASLESTLGPGRAWAVAMDVTDEASVELAIGAVLERYGGLDLLVSNAGVLRAGSVTSQSLAEFDLVSDVNYRGYFLAVKAVAPVLGRQHAARPDYLGDIIQVNSKSGLVGSSRNSAYAGSKFGGIGLTQSFALELLDDGIKVNAVCPGNYFEGPLWSDPENGLFMQYLREGKVPGAQSVEDVRRAYEAKVPMGRGVTPADVLEAILYLVAQRYETGQALPVTGGQVMLG